MHIHNLCIYKQLKIQIISKKIVFVESLPFITSRPPWILALTSPSIPNLQSNYLLKRLRYFNFSDTLSKYQYFRMKILKLIFQPKIIIIILYFFEGRLRFLDYFLLIRRKTISYFTKPLNTQCISRWSSIIVHSIRFFRIYKPIIPFPILNISWLY